MCSNQAIDLERQAPCLGRILSALHAFPVGEAIRLGVVRLDDFEDMHSIRDHATETLEQLRAKLQNSLWVRCRALLDREWLGSTPAPGRDVLLHGDLSAEHVLIAPAGGHVVGLIDWADACLGDPAYDFKFLWVWVGEELIDRILLHYSHPVDPAFLARVRAYGICTALDEVAYGLARGQHDNLRLGMAALERAIAGDGS
jgi:aminoglycoside phosphotransferase (APT) family kinase protein